MASILSDDVRYVKLILLLVKGGTFVAKKRIVRITNYYQKSIDAYLKENEIGLNEAMKKKGITEKQMRILFPGYSTATDLDCWDISLLSYILLELFGDRLTGDEKVAVRALRDTRNELAHSAATSLTEEQFLRKWTRLIMVLSKLEKQLTEADQDEYNATVDKISSLKDFQDATNELKLFERSDEFVQKILNEKLERGLNDCYHRIGELEASRVEMKGQLVIRARITVNALTPAEKDSAQAKLLKTMEQSIDHGNHPNDEDAVLTACNNLVSDMRDQGVDIVKVEQGSILISVRCPTLSALKNISSYFANRKYTERVLDFENALSQFVESPVNLDMSIVLQTLYSALAQLEKDADNKSVNLTLQCRGLEGVKNAFSFFGNGLPSLSEALSRSVGERIELGSTIDIEQLKNGIKELEEHNMARTRHVDLALAETASGGQALFESTCGESELSKSLSDGLAPPKAPSRRLQVH